MKKLFYLAFAALLAINFTFTSCSKDDEIPTPDSLTGTVWTGSISGNSMTLSFETDILYKLTLSGPAVGNVEGMWFYSYSKPNLVLNLVSEDESEEIHGTVAGNKMTLDLWGTDFVLTKK
jgi:hypothetical protein